jgi:hypothetical protein
MGAINGNEGEARNFELEDETYDGRRGELKSKTNLT